MPLFLVFVLSTVDAFFPLVPSETAVIAAGALNPNVFAVVAVAAAGAFLGDHVTYALGRATLGRRSLADTGTRSAGADARSADTNSAARAWGWLGAVRRLVARVAPQVATRGGQLLITGRFIPGGRTAATLACGATRYPLERFSAYAAVAATLWATYCGAIGYLGGAAFENNPLLGVITGVVIAVAISATIELARARRARTTLEPRSA